MAKGTGSKAPPPQSTSKMPAGLKKYWQSKNGEGKTAPAKSGGKKSGGKK
jgi:hypothetical protein